MARKLVRETPPVASSLNAQALLDPEPEVTATTPLPTPAAPASPPRKRRVPIPVVSQSHFSAFQGEVDGANHQAELFYLQKQIQLQTQMIFVLEDGQRVQGVIEWYDRNSIKVRGKARTLVYKSAIKYIYKGGEIGVAPDH